MGYQNSSWIAKQMIHRRNAWYAAKSIWSKKKQELCLACISFIKIVLIHGLKEETLAQYASLTLRKISLNKQCNEVCE